MDTTSRNRIWTNSALESNKLQLQNSFSIGRVEEPLNRTTLICIPRNLERWPNGAEILLQRLWLNAESKRADGNFQSNERTKRTASAAPWKRSMPASSHSTEIGPL